MLDKFFNSDGIGNVIQKANDAVSSKKEEAHTQYERLQRLEDDVHVIADKAREIDSLKKWAEAEVDNAKQEVENAKASAQKVKKYAIAGFGIVTALEIIIILFLIFK